MPTTDILVNEADFNVGELSERVRAYDGSNGALVTFTGMVRELQQSSVQLQALYLEHYPGMSDKALRAIANQARDRWPLGNIIIYHRIGTLELNENVVFVGITSAHRAAAFAAAQFIMDYLKRDAPFWKKEITKDDEYWVEQKISDQDAAARWE